MAEAAARLVLDLSRGREPSTLRVDLATRLVERSSTAAPVGAVEDAAAEDA